MTRSQNAEPGLFRTPREIVWGCGSVSWLRKVSGKRALLVTDETMVKLGVAARAASYLQEAGMETRLFDKVEPEPSVDTVERMLAEHREFEPDVIVGLGGGSPIDASKGFRIFLEHPTLAFSDITCRDSTLAKAIPPFTRTTHITISSTSGTGSDASHACVLAEPAIHAKWLILDPALVPDIAIVDPEIAASMPPTLLVDSGMDALTHALESYVNVKANDFSHAASLQATVLIAKSLGPAFSRREPEAQQHLHYGATIAGVAVANSGSGLCHSVANKVGPAFGLTHGRTLGVALPYVLRYNGAVCTDAFVHIARNLGYTGQKGGEATKFLISRVREIRAEIGIPNSFREAGIPADSYLPMVEGFAVRSESFPGTLENPRRPTREELVKLYLACYEGDYSRLL